MLAKVFTVVAFNVIPRFLALVAILLLSITAIAVEIEKRHEVQYQYFVYNIKRGKDYCFPFP